MAGFGGLIRGSWLGRLLRRYDDGRGVAASVITSVLARMASAVTTLLAMPVALNTLGPDRFAAFLVLLGFISWLSLGNLGVGAALARLLAAGEEAEDSRALIGAALVSATVTIGVFSILISLALFGWSHAQAGSLNAPRGELILAAGVLVALTAVQSVLQVFEGVLTGRLQIYTINLMRLAGSAFTLIALLTLPRLWGSMAVFVIAINGGVFVSTLLNAMVALRSARPTFRALHLNLGRIRRLAVSGFAFVVIVRRQNI